MTYKFSKRTLKNYQSPAHGRLDNCVCYTVFDNIDSVGEFIQKNAACFFTYRNRQFVVDFTFKLLKRSQHDIVDYLSKQKVGEFRIPGMGWQIGDLTLNDHERVFVCDEVTATTRFSFFKPNTWGYYRIRMSNDIDIVDYNFRLPYSYMLSKNWYRQPDFMGEIEFSGNDLLPVFAGLYLLENISYHSQFSHFPI